MNTIFCTEKLRKFFKPIMSDEILLSVGDQWNANLTFIDKRKCVAFIHKETLYVVVIFDILTRDLKNIKQLFTEAYIRQLYTDGILERENELLVRNQIGEMYFKPTDNDRKTIGSLTDTIKRISLIKEYQTFNMEAVKNYVSMYVNDTPMGAIKYAFPKDKMALKIKNLV